jgi:hypothetical protein
MTTTGTPEAGTVMSIITADRLAVWKTKQTGRLGLGLSGAERY